MAADEASAPDRRRAVARQHLHTQRRMLLCGASALLLLSFPLFDSESPVTLATSALVIAAAAAAFAPVRDTARLHILLVPLAVAATFSAHIIAGWATESAPSGTGFALMFAILAPFLGLIAPTPTGALAGLTVMIAAATAGGLAFHLYTPSFELIDALGFILAACALSVWMAMALTRARRETLTLRGELERRATSDELTGVSNRAHVNLLAQNEFSRARRYGEPYSCLIIEIDDYDRLVSLHGAGAAKTVVHLFTGYCVVVMRHCDSFGRLAPARFLALLPETPAAGAYTLATRMCRDLANLAVAFDGGKLRFTVSIGCAEMHVVDRWAGDLLRRVEQGLSDAQEGGGNTAVLASVPAYRPHDSADAADTTPLEP